MKKEEPEEETIEMILYKIPGREDGLEKVTERLKERVGKEGGTSSSKA